MIRLRTPTMHVGREPEWIMAVVLACWGLNALLDSLRDVARHTMDSPFYAPLTQWMGQPAWGLAALAVGLGRVICLWVNGSRPKGSTAFRALGAGASGFFWLVLVLGAFSLPWSSGAVWTYGGLCAFDLLALYRSAREVAPAWARAGPAYGRG